MEITGDGAFIIAAVITALGACIVAWIGRPSRSQRRDVRQIKEQFSTNGGSTAKDQLDRIESAQGATRDDVQRLAGQFNQHVHDSDEDKRMAHEEAKEMWAAIRAVAVAKPPKENQ